MYKCKTRHVRRNFGYTTLLNTKACWCRKKNITCGGWTWARKRVHQHCQLPKLRKPRATTQMQKRSQTQNNKKEHNKQNKPNTQNTQNNQNRQNTQSKQNKQDKQNKNRSYQTNKTHKTNKTKQTKQTK